MKQLSERKKKWIERTAENDRSYKLFLYNRFFIFLILVFLQLVISIGLAYSVVYDASRVGIILQALLLIAELVFVLYLINKNDRPSEKLNWILLILIVPVVGVPGYLLYGEAHLFGFANQLVGLAFSPSGTDNFSSIKPYLLY